MGSKAARRRGAKSSAPLRRPWAGRARRAAEAFLDQKA